MFKGSYLFQTIILGIHVSFQGCNRDLFHQQFQVESLETYHLSPPLFSPVGKQIVRVYHHPKGTTIKKTW